MSINRSTIYSFSCSVSTNPSLSVSTSPPFLESVSRLFKSSLKRGRSVTDRGELSGVSLSRGERRTPSNELQEPNRIVSRNENEQNVTGPLSRRVAVSPGERASAIFHCGISVATVKREIRATLFPAVEIWLRPTISSRSSFFVSPRQNEVIQPLDNGII